MDGNRETVEPATSRVNVQPTTVRNALEKHVEQNTNVKQVAAALADVNAALSETVDAETDAIREVEDDRKAKSLTR